jgi:predicted dehydrogenase
MPLTVSVVGVGKIGWKHAAILSSMSEVELGPLVDVDEKRAAEASARFGTAATGLDAAIDRADCLFVCTPDPEHTDVTLRAIDAGVHTFVEKPLATTSEETERLRAAAAASDAVHMVGHVLRFDPRYRAVRSAVRDGDVGDLVTVTMERLVKRARLRRTGGVSPPWMRLGVHDFDLLEWACATSVTSLSAVESAGKLGGDGSAVDEAVSVLASLDGGGSATLTMGFCLPDGHPGSIVRTVASGSEGTVAVDASGDETQRWGERGGSAVDTHLWPDVAGTPDGALARQDRAFVRAVRQGDSSPVPFAAGHRAVRIAEAVGTAVSDGERVTVPVP